MMAHWKPEETCSIVLLPPHAGLYTATAKEFKRLQEAVACQVCDYEEQQVALRALGLKIKEEAIRRFGGRPIRKDSAEVMNLWMEAFVPDSPFIFVLAPIRHVCDRDDPDIARGWRSQVCMCATRGPNPISLQLK